MKLHILSLLLLVLLLASCSKDFLGKRQNSTLAIPQKLDDFFKILEADVMREGPAFGEMSSDDYYMTNDVWMGFSDLVERNIYIWEKSPYEGTKPVTDWNTPYKQVFYANVVLDGLGKLDAEAKKTSYYNEVMGFALFLRANSFYNLAQVYAPPYQKSLENTPDLGIPLRLSPNVDDVTVRATLKETYNRIIEDLKASVRLLPRTFSNNYRNRPSQLASFALLARVYLSIRQYEDAKNCADSALSIYNTLIDYNTISTTAALPFTRLNIETFYQGSLNGDADILTGLRLTAGICVDSALYKMYNDNDLRKKIFYSDSKNAKGSYIERGRFCGLATDELFLIRAECNARIGDLDVAQKTINDFLITRYKRNGTQTTYVDFLTTNRDTALDFILMERRKQLVHRGLRWSDLRRLNLEGRNIQIKRVVNGKEYLLPPNDNRYVAPIPNDVISFSKIPQNNR